MSDSNPIPDIFAAAKEEPETGATKFQATADLLGINLSDVTPEVSARKKAEEELGVFVPELPAHASAPTNTPIMHDAVGDARIDPDASFNADTQKGKVSVSHEERERFVRAALHDSEMFFEIELEGVDMCVEVAIPSDNFTASVSAALNAWAKAGQIDADSTMQTLLAFQQIHAWFQIRKINGESTGWASFFEDGLPASGKIREFISDPKNFEVFFAMGAIRWRCIVEALQLAEHKYKLCLEAWRDKSFFTRADTA